MQHRSCDRPNCTSSRYRDQYLTFGWGSLDVEGFWEYPCWDCAAAFDARREEFLDNTREVLKAAGQSDAQIEAYIAAPSSAWMHNPAWPFETEPELSGLLEAQLGELVSAY